MTETIEQNSTADAGSAAATAAPKNKPLSAMLLPELRQLAASMGIATANKKKTDLVSAVRAARSGSSDAGGDSRPARGAGGNDRADRAERSGGPAQSESRSDAVAATQAPTEAPRTDRQNERQNDAARDGQRDSQRDGQTRERQNGQNSQGTQNGQTRANNGNRQNRNDNQNRDQGSGGNQNNQNRNDNQNRDQNRDQSSGGNQNNQSRNDNQNREQNRDQGSGGNQNNQNRNDQNRGNDQDDDDRGGRRGRRYRDRRGRSRDRDRTGGGGGNSNSDVEPTISEDDVLVPVAGILDAIEDKNTWFVRTSGYFAGDDDVYVAASYVRRFGLRRGDTVTGAVRQARDGERREKYNPLVRLDTVNGRNPEDIKGRTEFTKLTPLYPQERLRLETEPHILTTRVIDLVMPIGKGQRALIASPPKAGKTMVLQSIANAIATNNPEVHLMVVLVDERPEEVTDMQRSVKGEVVASTFDRRPQDHTMVAELSIERAKRLVEMGMDVVVLLDSITRLGRAYNLAAPASGRILSGGVDSTALYPPKRFLGAARNIENGGSLTIIATALVETGSAGDSVIFEEFKGTGNAELKLDRKIADKRTFPAIDVDQSSTRKEELLLGPDEMAVTVKLRRVLHALDPQQAIDLLLDRLRKTRTNYEFLMQIAKTSPGQD